MKEKKKYQEDIVGIILKYKVFQMISWLFLLMIFAYFFITLIVCFINPENISNLYLSTTFLVFTILLIVLNHFSTLNTIKKNRRYNERIINQLDNLNIFDSNNEKNIFTNNLRTLQMLEYTKDYKYCLIAMGSILEFFLMRYCKLYNVKPDTYIDANNKPFDAKNKKFVNYVQSAIKNNLFGQKNSWYIIQNNLRNFRNYVHISKEVQDEKIDYDWYNSIRPSFFRILENVSKTIF